MFYSLFVSSILAMNAFTFTAATPMVSEEPSEEQVVIQDEEEQSEAANA